MRNALWVAVLLFSFIGIACEVDDDTNGGIGTSPSWVPDPSAESAPAMATAPDAGPDADL